MKRNAHKKPGHDCLYTKCTLTDPPCVPNTGSSHGISSDRWIYEVMSDDGSAALRMTAISEDFPESVPMEHFSYKSSMGAYLSLHLRPDNGDGVDCDLLPSKRCCAHDLGATYPYEFFKEHGGKEFEQPESFWKAMETAMLKHVEEYRSE